MPKKRDNHSWSSIEPVLRSVFNKKIKFANEMHFRKFLNRAISQRSILLKSAFRYGTPQYIVDEDYLVKRALLIKKTFSRYIKNLKVFYAFKCNDLPWVVRKLKGIGVYADVASLFELKLALRMGFGKIIFTSPAKTEEEIKLALKNYRSVILNIDSFDELRDILSIINSQNHENPLGVSLRVNTNNTTAKKWSKFGFKIDEIKTAAEMIKKSKRLVWKGLHFHSSWNSSPESYVQSIKIISEYLKNNFSEDCLKSLKFLDIGGGFLPEGSEPLLGSRGRGMLLEIAADHSGKEINLTKVSVNKKEPIFSFAKKISAAVKECITKKLKLPNLEIWIEPGRFIASLPTYILVKVQAVKKDSVIVDGGINLIGSYDFLYDFYPIINITRPSLELVKTKIYGPLCDPNDVMGYYYFGKKCRKNDILAVMHQGAYTFSTAWRFIRPIAPYLSFSGKRIVLAKKEETFKQRYMGCRF